jgi:hypothetical protein
MGRSFQKSSGQRRKNWKRKSRLNTKSVRLTDEKPEAHVFIEEASLVRKP